MARTNPNPESTLEEKRPTLFLGSKAGLETLEVRSTSKSESVLGRASLLSPAIVFSFWILNVCKKTVPLGNGHHVCWLWANVPESDPVKLAHVK